MSAIAVFALALGIGLTTVMFSIVYGALHRGLPFEGADRIMSVNRSNPARGAFRIGVPIHDYLDWRTRQRAFEDLGAFYAGTVNVRSGDTPERYAGAFITANTLPILGVTPVLGRTLLPEDERPGAPHALLLGYRVWQDRFGGDRGVLGRDVTVNGEPGTIVGVLPDGFLFPANQEVWTPLRLDATALPRGEGQSLTVFGRLREGVSLDRASSELTSVAAALAAEHPASNEGVVTEIRPFTADFMGDEERTVLYTMLATVTLVLFIACANVANLLLARAATRTRDVAIRTALGSSRRRVVLQLLAEALVLTLGGAALGTVFAWLGIGLFDRAVSVTDPPFWFVFELDAPIVGFVVGVSALAALLSGAIPALRASSTDLNAVLKDESRGASSLQIGRLSRALVIAEVAMSVALLVASGLLMQSVVRLDRMELSFPTDDVFTARLGAFEARFPDEAARLRFWEEVEERVAAIPGVRAAAVMNPAAGLETGTQVVTLDGETWASDAQLPRARGGTITPRFFDVFGVAALQGRTFTQLDAADAAPVALVNQSFVRERFPDGNALGRRLRLGRPDGDGPWREIVGVVPDLDMQGVGTPGEESGAGFYLPLSQSDQRFLTIAARTDGDPLAITARVRDEVAAADPDTPIYFVGTLQQRIDEELWFYGVFGTLFSVFGAAALFLASVGLYGVMSFSVSRRVREMGIRMALGAQAAQVRGLVLRQGLGQIGLGLVFGTGLAWLFARGLQVLFLGARPWDPATYALVFALLTATGVLASAIPARRATRVDPVQALHAE